jgi:hypothetical protein
MTLQAWLRLYGITQIDFKNDPDAHSVKPSAFRN